MAYPQVATTSTSFDVETTSHTITMPSGITAGNLLIIFFTSDGADNFSSSSAGWTQLYETTSLTLTSSVYYKIAAGSDTLTITTDNTESSSAIAYRITGSDTLVPSYNSVAASSANANPPSCNSIAGSLEYLWLVYVGYEGIIDTSAAPTDFTGLVEYISGGATEPSSASAQREYTTGSAYDPDAFTSGNTSYIAWTVCIAPIGASGIGIGSIAYYEYGI